MRLNVSCGIYVGQLNPSFKSYLKKCYPNCIIDDLEKVSTQYLVHGFTYQENFLPQHDNYYYVSVEEHATNNYSESELFLNVVKGLFPSGALNKTLGQLIGAKTTRIENISIANKSILYPGGSSINSSRRWPHFAALIKELGEDHVLIIGGKDDLNFEKSYVYPNWMRGFPQFILNQKRVWNFLKKIKILKKWAHHQFDKESHAFFNYFNWEELVYLFRHSKQFVGNDGGLTHLAAAAGAKGIILFGPTSSKKNKPYNTAIKVLQSDRFCSPCQYAVGGIAMTKNYINCPYQIDCLNKISVNQVLNNL